MSGQGSGAQQKTEPATPRRLREARKKGDVWQSRDLTATVGLLVAAALFSLAGRPLIDGLAGELQGVLQLATDPTLETAALEGLVQRLLFKVLSITLPQSSPSRP